MSHIISICRQPVDWQQCPSCSCCTVLYCTLLATKRWRLLHHGFVLLLVTSHRPLPSWVTTKIFFVSLKIFFQTKEEGTAPWLLFCWSLPPAQVTTATTQACQLLFSPQLSLLLYIFWSSGTVLACRGRKPRVFCEFVFYSEAILPFSKNTHSCIGRADSVSY